MKAILPKLSEITKQEDAVIIRNSMASSNRQDIAVIGMDLTFAHAKNASEFWKVIAKGEDCIRSIPKNRFDDLTDYFNSIEEKKDERSLKQLAYLDEVDLFDYNFFHLSKKEASLMDPNQRLFLQCAYHAIEDAGYINRIEGSNTGVYVGYKSSLANIYYDMVHNMEPEFIDMASVGNKAPVIASRISYLLDLHGPNLILDTACSSSLVALHLACQAIREEECETAIVGSIRLDLLPLISEFNIGIESSDGRTRSFDASSDGTGGGEGVAAIFLKPLDKALCDKDHVYAVIKASAVNQDGRSIGITAPSAKAQEDVILRAWKKGGINPTTIGYVEAHGTGTKLGDPIEIEGLTNAFHKYTMKNQICCVGSVKANLGHLDNCAGMAGIVKAILMLNNKKIPPLAHFEIPNPEIDFFHSPFYINQELTDWKSKTPRRCGVSAFGLSGTNAHVVLEEANQLREIVDIDGKLPFVITAKSEKSLEEYVKSFIYFLKDTTETLYDICYTMALKRKHYNLRLSFLIDSKEELVQCLNEWLHDKTMESKKRILAFEQGKEIELTAYFKQPTVTLSLPLYPFEKERCWMNYKKQNQESVNEALKCDIHTAIKNVYEEVLAVHPINEDMTLYELGGDSLIALKIANTLSAQYGIKVEISDILVHGSVVMLTKYCERRKENEVEEVDLFRYLSKAKEQDGYPLSSPQKRMFVMDWYQNIGSVYNMNRAFLVHGPLDIKKTKWVFQQIVNRHESLRTSFDFIDEEPVQMIHQNAVLEVEEADITKEQIEDMVRKFFRKFDLKQMPLFRVGILTLNPLEHVLILDMHHIISDGTSTSVIMKDFVTLYEGGTLPELSFHYRDYTMWQIECRDRKEMRMQREYWHNIFKDQVPVLMMPYDNKRPEERDFKGTRVPGIIQEDMVASLRKLANEKNTSLHILLLCAYYILLAKYSSQEDIVVGVATSGRNSKLIENNVGMFVNTLPIRAYPDGSKEIQCFLDELTQISYEAYRNQDYQLDELIENLHVNRDSSRNPLFDAVFTITKYEKIQMKELDFEVLDYDMIKARFDLIMTMCDYIDHIDFGITYATALFEKSTIEKMLEDYIEILDQFLTDLSQTIDNTLVKDYSNQLKSSMVSFDAEFNL